MHKQLTISEKNLKNRRFASLQVEINPLHLRSR